MLSVIAIGETVLIIVANAITNLLEKHLASRLGRAGLCRAGLN